MQYMVIQRVRYSERYPDRGICVPVSFAIVYVYIIPYYNITYNASHYDYTAVYAADYILYIITVVRRPITAVSAGTCYVSVVEIFFFYPSPS